MRRILSIAFVVLSAVVIVTARSGMQDPGPSEGEKKLIDLKSDLMGPVAPGDSAVFLVGNFAAQHNGAVIIGTGRRKDGSFMASMYDEGQAIRLPFPHHSSRKDARFLSESNCFQTVLPFHSNVKEVWNG